LTIPRAKPIIRAEVVERGLKITKSWFSKRLNLGDQLYHE